ncbi:helix-turn-helix transcriptional regulator [Paenibacillus sp. 7516]|uniref:helix-turn-helix domain-containing protein n=1 Tax=Paenibacillus sp. 7516 TaxID=2022549 RepID=UPI000BA609C6|nr:helix-turn-helix transcriptional regulator [Paenibacillus sp. 7516]PAF29405.1 hypothetical protein CHI14_22855 [Paenibacillus sp. 7516]
METTPTICSYIEDYMKKRGHKLQHFSDITGINVGSLSGILKGSRSMSMNQLDQITSAMGLEKGYFYERYGVENFIESAPHWRRLEPFLYGCAELNKQECIRKIVVQVTDNRSYISELFRMAENLFSRGLNEAALVLYECVADSEKYQHSERLALCQYRIFLLLKTMSKLENTNAAVKFEAYIDKLNEEVQLDAIKDLANVYSTMHQWDKVYELAEELERRVDFLLKFQSKRPRNKKRISFYPLFTYKAYANLLKANVSEVHKQYMQALRYTDIYVDLMEEVNDPTKEEKELIERFKGWAEGNRCLYKLLSGDFKVLGTYLDYLDDNPKEILTAFVYIVQAANKYLFNIDCALDRFSTYINQIRTDNHVKGTYNKQALNYRYMRLFFELAKYRLNQKKFRHGIELLIVSLQRSSLSKDDIMCIQCIDLYGKYRAHASKDQEEQYKNLVESLSSKI